LVGEAGKGVGDEDEDGEDAGFLGGVTRKLFRNQEVEGRHGCTTKIKIA
jgi:hypothetical protein